MFIALELFSNRSLPCLRLLLERPSYSAENSAVHMPVYTSRLESMNLQSVAIQYRCVISSYSTFSLRVREHRSHDVLPD
jgi:hypothetical protein